MISAADVKALREKTGAGMMDCKRALVEAAGNADQAEQALKERGLLEVKKREDRDTNEGKIFLKTTGKRGALVKLTCETDFVSRNGDFTALGETCLDAVFSRNDTGSGTSAVLDEYVKDTIAKIKENIVLESARVLQAGENEILTGYLHGEGRIGVLLVLEIRETASAEDPSVQRQVQTAVQDLTLHLAAFAPKYISREDALADRQYMEEKEALFRKEAEELGKPAAVTEGIIKGKMNKHLTKICFLEQPFIREDKKTTAEVLTDFAAAGGPEILIKQFAYQAVGENT